MADQAQCLANAHIIDPTAKLCEDWTCEKKKQVTLYCHCAAPYPPPPPGMPCPYGPSSPVFVPISPTEECVCCCSCFAYGTAIAIPDGGFKKIEQFVVEDTVLAAGVDLKWTPYTVDFSAGIVPSPDA